MLCPEGYTQIQVLEIIEKVISKIAHKYKFDMWDIEDIKAESFILCVKLLTKYNGSSPLENFLAACLPNELKNFRRDNSYRAGQHCSRHAEFTRDCLSCEATASKQLAKRNVLNPINIEQVDMEGQTNLMRADENSFELKEMMRQINVELPAAMRKDYLKMKEGLYVARQKRIEIENEIRKIIGS